MDGSAGSGTERPAEFELVRVCIAPAGAFGVLLSDGLPCGPLTLERTYPLIGARPFGPQVVKIPRGRYRCHRTFFHRGQYSTFEVMVPGHSRLLFHRGNIEDNSEGCILLGRRFGILDGRPAVLDSGGGFADFMRLNGDRQVFDLEVRST